MVDVHYFNIVVQNFMLMELHEPQIFIVALLQDLQIACAVIMHQDIKKNMQEKFTKRIKSWKINKKNDLIIFNVNKEY
jgi:hypothetical protein